MEQGQRLLFRYETRCEFTEVGYFLAFSMYYSILDGQGLGYPVVLLRTIAGEIKSVRIDNVKIVY